MSLIGQDLKLRVSYAKKIANDYQRAKDIMDIYDTWYGDYRDSDLINKYNINYDLFNGRLDVKLYDDPICLNIDGKKVVFEYNSITHYPLISQVANAMYGEMIARHFKPMAKDIGTSAQTLRNKKWNEMIRESLNADVINPIKGELTQQFIQQGRMRGLPLSEEFFQQLEQQVDEGIRAKTPEEILDFMDNDFKTPTLRQAQRLLDYFVAHENIKSKQDEGFKHAIITGVEVYYVGEENGEPVFRLCNPKDITWGGSQNTEWIQDATWVKHETWLTLEEATQEFAEYLDKNDYKELEGLLEIIPGRQKVDDYKRDFVQQRVMYELSLEDSIIAKKYGDADYKTKKGQSKIKDIYAEVMKKYGMDGVTYSSFGIRKAHICWIDKRKIYRVKRKDPVTKKVKTHYEDEHYTIQPEDIEVREIWVSEPWEGIKLGSTGINDIYLRIRPIPSAQKSVYNPYGVKLPYVGKCFNVHMNNSKNVSLVDLGKPWQKEFDITMAQIKHDMATDFGTVFMMSLAWMPDNMSPQEWFDILRNGNLLLTNFSRGNIGLDPNLLRSIQMGKTQDILAKYQALDMLRGNLVRAMNFNDYRIGAIGQYATNANTEQAQVASYNQTEGYFETHRKIVEAALNQFMNTAKFLYRDNEKLKFILDDVARTELELSPDFWYEEWAIEFTTSSEEIKKVQELRQLMLSFVQNGMSFEGILALSLADTPSDIMDIIKKEQKRMDTQRAEDAQRAQEEIRAKIQAELQDKMEERQLKYKMHSETLASQERRSAIDADKFRIQNDVDRNNLADTIQQSLIELGEKRAIEDAKLKLEKETHDSDQQVEMKKHSDTMQIEREKLKLADKKLDVDKLKISSQKSTKKSGK